MYPSYRRPVAAALLLALLFARPSLGQMTWGNYAGNPQHTALSGVASQRLQRIRWQTPVDLDPQYSGTSLLVHYGSPLVTAANTVIVPVKTGKTDGFRVEARSGADGTLRWQFDSDYRLPAHNWTPSFSPALTPTGRLYLPGAGGTLFFQDNVDGAGPVAPTRVAFYGLANYNANPNAFNSSIRICTPLTPDAQGNVYFGFRAAGSNPLGIQSGIARVATDGTASFVTAAAASGGQSSQVVMNCAPALSNDGSTLYIATNNGGFSGGNLLAIDTQTLATKAQIRLKDPKSGNDAFLPDDGTASPTVGTDGNVFFGVLENPFNSSKGWLLQFDGALTQARTPGAFGWDDTASLVPASMLTAYHGTSSYLLMTKYNNYAGLGGDGVNQIAILDPNDTQVDVRTGATVMKEVLTIAGVTPDPEYIATHPDAVREWCINNAVVDPLTCTVLANSEDGKLYRWDLDTNTFSEIITLTAGIGEAYTPTLIGQDGTVYAINNATLFAVGAFNAPEPGTLALALLGGVGALAIRRKRRL